MFFFSETPYTYNILLLILAQKSVIKIQLDCISDIYAPSLDIRMNEFISSPLYRNVSWSFWAMQGLRTGFLELCILLLLHPSHSSPSWISLLSPRFLANSDMKHRHIHFCLYVLPPSTQIPFINVLFLLISVVMPWGQHHWLLNSVICLIWSSPLRLFLWSHITMCICTWR